CNNYHIKPNPPILYTHTDIDPHCTSWLDKKYLNKQIFLTYDCEVLEHTDVVFICVKPHILGQCASQLKYKHVPSAKDASKLIVSVLAGTSLKTLEEKFDFIESSGPKVIRTMPNTSMQVGEGCTVYTGNARVTHQDLEKVHIMLNALGLAQQVPEQMIDAVTGLAGCGPAFVYTIIEALADGGVKQGVPRAMALQFAAQTLLGNHPILKLQFFCLFPVGRRILVQFR
ncbi:pyrroline-5-carboxylate reductase 1, mitochondrial-like, partial [Drosophila pseudoobscura]|uniref:Pyrroline-5-carboxylate reductase 1, mitochondrial-like n=1 Tax=Drosophila pseudoobscura pseudoobscura TaxID=46245 RepID=A0A6I8VWU0_DROPS